MDVDSDKKTSEPETPAKNASSEPDSLGDLIPNFDFSSLPGLSDKTGPEIALAEPEKTKTAQAAQEPAAQAQAKTKSPGEAADDFVIELSENDLESLLLELDSTSKSEADEEKADAPPRKQK